MEMGMDIDAERKCPYPLWGQEIRANEGRSRVCSDYAGSSLKWTKSKMV